MFLKQANVQLLSLHLAKCNIFKKVLQMRMNWFRVMSSHSRMSLDGETFLKQSLKKKKCAIMPEIK